MPTPTPAEEEARIEHQVHEVVSRGPSGAFAVAGVATAIVVALYFAFYFVVYLPRGSVQ
ncbi:MAG: hypothetical protein ACJ8G7_12600 [Rhizobacter sp.]